MEYKMLKIKSEASRCLLCHDAPCNCCPKGLAVSDIIRSLCFENNNGAAKKIGSVSCADCDAPCEQACIRAKIDTKIDISGLLSCITQGKETETKADLSIDFCGVHCENPFFLSSSVVGSNYEMVAKAFDLGWAGVAFKTIGYLKQLKRDYPEKIIIASIMGQNEEEWTKLAALMEQSGTDIIECNFSCPQMVGKGLGSDVGTDPDLVARYVAATKRGTKLPVLAKMTPNITKMEIPARAAMAAGASGLAAINTIKSVMNIDLEHFSSEPDIEGKSTVGGYSGKAVKPIALRFIHDLKKDEQLKDVPISGMGGIETWRDAAEFLSLGCETVQVTTSVMQYGYRVIDDIIDGMNDYLCRIGAQSVREIVGKALPSLVAADAVDRDTIEYPRFDRKSCVGCGRCYISCFDGGHQAIHMDENRHPIMNARKCVGCQLCRLVCSVGAISAGKRVKKRLND